MTKQEASWLVQSTEEIKKQRPSVRVAVMGGNSVREFETHMGIPAEEALGLEIVLSPFIKTDHCFWFATIKDADEFIMGITELIAEGFDWDAILEGVLRVARGRFTSEKIKAPRGDELH